MILIIFFIICVVGTLLYSFFKEHIYLHELKRREDSCCKTLLISSGKKMHAFTIEKSKLVNGSVAYSVGGLYKFMLKILGLFSKNLFVNNYIKQVALKEALVTLKEQSYPADYIIDVKFEVVSLGIGEVVANAYGTALYLYKDTLGLFDCPEEIEFKSFRKIKSLIFERIITLVALTSIVLSTLFYSYFRLADLALSNFNHENEKVLWSFLKHSALEKRVEGHVLFEAEEKLQSYVDQIAKLNDANERNFKIYLLNIDEPELYIYPNNIITITIGMLKSIKSENALVYLLAHEMAHLLNKDLLTNQHTDIITEYIATNLLDDESLLGSLIISKSDFNQIVFAEKEEEIADNFAINTLNLVYGHIEGIDEAISYNLNQFPMLANIHPVTGLRLKKMNSYIQERKFEKKQTQLLHIDLIDKNINQNTKGSSIKNVKSNNVIDEFFIRFNSFSTDYRNFIASYDNVLILEDKITKKELDNRLSSLDSGKGRIREFQAAFYDLITEYNQKVDAEVQHELNQYKAKLFVLEWNKDRDAQIKIAELTFNKDYNILLAKQRLINFLNRRFGTFKIVNNKITFDSINASEQYNSIYQQLIQSYQANNN